MIVLLLRKAYIAFELHHIAPPPLYLQIQLYTISLIPLNVLRSSTELNWISSFFTVSKLLYYDYT